MKEVILNIQGMSCQGCTSAVEKAILAVAGVSSVEVDLANHQARVRIHEHECQIAALMEAIDDIGFEASQAN